MSNKQLTLETFLEGFEREIQEHLFYLGTMYGDHAVARLMDVPYRDLSLSEPPRVDLNNTHLGVHARWLYQYANEGELYRGFDVPPLDDALRVIDLLCMTNLECNGGLDSAVECIWRKAIARARFDNMRCELDLVSEDVESVWVVGGMTIEDVAWLCGMSPASVRNSTTAKAQDRLVTYRENGKVYVDPTSLVDWLSRRRGYQETEVIELKEAEDEVFSDLDGLQQFLASRMRNLKIDIDAVADATGLETTTIFRFHLGNDLPEDCWEIDTIIGLAKVLELTDSNFISRATAVVLEYKLKRAGVAPKAEVIPFKSRNKARR